MNVAVLGHLSVETILEVLISIYTVYIYIYIYTDLVIKYIFEITELANLIDLKL